MVQAFKKIVVYILLFSFFLVDLPQGVLAAEPTPAPTYNVGWSYVYKTIEGDTAQGESDTKETYLRFYYGSSADQYIDFSNIHHQVDLWGLDTNSYAIDSTEGGSSSSSKYNVNDSGKWDLWASKNVPSNTQPKFYIISTSMLSSDNQDDVVNICFANGEDSKITTETNTHYINTGGNTEYTYKCFNKITNPTNGKGGPIINQTKTTVPNTLSLPPNYLEAFKKIVVGKFSFASIKPAGRASGTPKAENVTACKNFSTERLLDTEEKTKIWVTSMKQKIEAGVSESVGSSLSEADLAPTEDTKNFAQEFFKNDNKVKTLITKLKDYDVTAYKNYYGSIPPAPGYPNVALSDTQNNKLKDEFQSLQSELPFEYTPSEADREFQRKLIYGGIAVLAGVLTGGVAASYAQAVAAGTVEKISFAAAPMLGNSIPALQASAVSSLPSTFAGGTASAAIVQTWIIAGGTATGLATSYGIWKASKTGNVISDIFNDLEKRSLIDEWILAVTKYQLDLAYAGFNTGFNQCLEKKGDEYAFVNPAILQTINSLGSSSLEDSGSFNVATKGDANDACGNIMTTGIINWAFCEISKAIFYIVRAFVTFANKTALSVIGVTVSSR